LGILQGPAQHRRPAYARKMRELLPDRPPMLCWTLEYPQEQMDGPPFSVRQAEVEELFGDAYELEPLRDWDVIDESERFRERGLKELHERVYRLLAREG
ncbi:MAG TPA: thiopurine S-methyltransferase, partial [Gammaproteobacteria bacterium]|nr:thiopurine S-methyltransferase [Gammaproteobacteria bacterium]